MGRRIRWMGLVLIVCFALVVLQLVNIQFRQAGTLNASGKNPRNTADQTDNQRGTIFAATGTPVAVSKRVLDAKAGTGTPEYYRTYPTGTLFSGVVGYDSSFYGTAGVENAYNTKLELHSRSAESFGQLLSPPSPSTDDVTLTVEKPLQQDAQQALAAIPDVNKDGAVVALQPKTGAVLAMYSSPSFDPNTLSQPDVTKQEQAGHVDFHTADHEGYTYGDPMATFDSFEPGSTFKVVTSAAVYDLDPSLITFDYPVQRCTTPGSIPTTDDQICNDGHTEATASTCGGTMVLMLPESCDPGYATLGIKLGATKLYEQAESFGYNSVPPIDLTTQLVLRSKFPTPTELTAGHSPGPAGVAYSAFGQQTVGATALQNAMVAEGIADTGVVMTPHVMASVRTNAQDQRVESYTPTTYKTATTASAAQSVKKLMQGVVTTPNGTAHDVGFPAQDTVAVKTGTAQEGTEAQNTIDWMIGFAPASDPTVAIVVVVPQQATTYSGASIAGPIMLKMVEASLTLQAHQAQAQQSEATTTTTTTTAPHRSTATTVPAATAVPAATPTTAPAATTITPTTVASATTTTTVPTPPPVTTTTSPGTAVARTPATSG